MNKKVFISIIILITLIKVFLISVLPIYVLAGAGHDDRLMLNMAESLLNGQWLGQYSEMTLVKGITYPAFIAVNYVLGIPLMYGETFLYIIACMLFIYSVSTLICKKIYLVITYTFLIFNPISYALSTYQRIYRDSIYYSLIMIFMSCMFLVYLKSNKNMGVFFKWSLLSGLSLAAVWHTREDGIWIIPFVLVSIVFIMKNSYKKYKKKGLLLASMPIIILLMANLLVSSLNYLVYDEFMVNELKSGAFPKTYNALTNIENYNLKHKVPVSKKTREVIYTISPSFAELETYLEGEGGKAWGDASRGTGTITDEGEIGEGHFMWALRAAVANRGYYESAETADSYYKRINNEISSAIEKGVLTPKTEMQTPLITAINKEQFPDLCNNIIKTVYNIMEYTDISFDFDAKSQGEEMDLNHIENLVGDKSREGKTLNFNGWLVTNEENLVIQVENKSNNQKILIELADSHDVASYFSNKNQDYANMENARFSQVLIQGDNYLLIEVDGKLVDQIPLDGTVMSKETEQFQLYIDQIQGEDHIKGYKVDQIKIKALSLINTIYKEGAKYVYLLGMVCYLYLCVIRCCKKLEGDSSLDSILLLSTGIALTVCVRIFAIAYNTTTSFPSISYMYLSPCYPLMIEFSLLSIFGMIAVRTEKILAIRKDNYYGK